MSSFHVINMGNMVKRAGNPMFLPCTPRGIMELLRSTGISQDMYVSMTVIAYIILKVLLLPANKQLLWVEVILW